MSNRFDALQVIRGFAACIVLLLHGSGSCQAQWGYSYATNRLKFGSSGVDIFFVLSGFIIYYTSTNTRLTRTEFLLRRCARISYLLGRTEPYLFSILS